MTKCAFASATFFDVESGVEQLTHDNPMDAIVAYFDQLAMVDGETLAERIESECPLMVYGFTRMEADLTVFADGMADALEESIRDDDELGLKPDFGDYEPIKWDRFALVKAIEDAIRPFGAQVEPFGCEPTSKREYSADEVREILHKCWFDEVPK